MQKNQNLDLLGKFIKKLTIRRSLNMVREFTSRENTNITKNALSFSRYGIQLLAKKGFEILANFVNFYDQTST